MNTEPKFKLPLSPREELSHLVQITVGLLASGQCIPSTGPHVDNGEGDSILARDAARQVLEQLRWDVERCVEEFPERYTVADQMPTS